ncbi:hypothetical protein [Nostoc sp. C052]|uniref:hypothetical protein n=1 Tax=Nostoc sp. C052 TaxID=2576902 RepID=UPI0015C3486B|nr:hypothetical protein [Nostoc sp. C052]
MINFEGFILAKNVRNSYSPGKYINTNKFVEVAAYLESLLGNYSRREAFRV